MGVRRIDVELCNGCGDCILNCPMDVLRLDAVTNKAMIKYIRDCQSCALCEAECPEQAIFCTPTFERRVVTAW